MLRQTLWNGPYSRYTRLILQPHDEKILQATPRCAIIFEVGGAWLSLVERSVRDREVREFKSRHPDHFCIYPIFRLSHQPPPTEPFLTTFPSQRLYLHQYSNQTYWRTLTRGPSPPCQVARPAVIACLANQFDVWRRQCRRRPFKTRKYNHRRNDSKNQSCAYYTGRFSCRKRGIDMPRRLMNVRPTMECPHALLFRRHHQEKRC